MDRKFYLFQLLLCLGDIVSKINCGVASSFSLFLTSFKNSPKIDFIKVYQILTKTEDWRDKQQFNLYIVLYINCTSQFSEKPKKWDWKFWRHFWWKHFSITNSTISMTRTLLCITKTLFQSFGYFFPHFLEKKWFFPYLKSDFPQAFER